MEAGGFAAVPAPGAQGGVVREQFVGFMLRNLDAADLEFLTRASVANPLHPSLARELADDDEAPQRLARLVRETPVFVAGEQSEWVQMHSLAQRVAAWLASHEMIALAS